MAFHIIPIAAGVAGGLIIRQYVKSKGPKLPKNRRPRRKK